MKVERRELGGETYLRIFNDREYDDLGVFEALIRARDFRPRSIAIEESDGDKRWTATWSITRWSVLKRESLDDDFFSYEHVRAVKPRGAPVQKAE